MSSTSREVPINKKPKKRITTINPQQGQTSYRKKEARFYKKYGYYPGDVEGGRSIYSDISSESSQISESENERRRSEMKRMRLTPEDRDIAAKQQYNYEVAKENGNPLALSKYFVYSHVPYNEYNPSIPENKTKTIFSLYDDARINDKFTSDDEHQFVRDYYEAYATKQAKMRSSPWIQHIRDTAEYMKRNNIKFKRGELFRRAARTYTGRKVTKAPEYTRLPFGLAGTAVGYQARKKYNPYKRIFPKQ